MLPNLLNCSTASWSASEGRQRDQLGDGRSCMICSCSCAHREPQTLAIVASMHCLHICDTGRLAAAQADAAGLVASMPVNYSSGAVSER